MNTLYLLKKNSILNPLPSFISLVLLGPALHSVLNVIIIVICVYCIRVRVKIEKLSLSTRVNTCTIDLLRMCISFLINTCQHKKKTPNSDRMIAIEPIAYVSTNYGPFILLSLLSHKKAPNKEKVQYFQNVNER